jgi:Flp pilus assembly protein TadD
LLEQNRLADALRVYRQAVERQPMDGELWQGLGTAYAKLGMHQEARDAFANAASMTKSERQAVPDAPLSH